MRPSDVSAVVCTLNAATSIGRCLASLRASGVGELIVVDGGSTDGTLDVAFAMADLVLHDAGTGLAAARNLGIARTSLPLVLNFGPDNAAPPGALQRMLDDMASWGVDGIGAQQCNEGDGFLVRGVNAWRVRFTPGIRPVIGTPSMFDGDLLRSFPFDPSRRFSDDSEMCERWGRELSAVFAISGAVVDDVGHSSWPAVRFRARMFGISDSEVYRAGVAGGWPSRRRLRSLTHPWRSDFWFPARRTRDPRAWAFLAAFTALRYASWARAALNR